MAASIEEWLKEIGLAQYAELFVQNAVDRATLEILTDDDLKELGLPFGPRKRVRAALAAGRQPAMAVSPSRLGPAPDGERRQLTVLFCDMVGSTEIARRVEPETLQIIVRLYEDCCEACIGHFDGYVYQHLGDGIVAFFGYPLAHEGEAARAIRAALEIQQAIARLEVPEIGRLEVRIGIDAGIVVVAEDERSVVGEAMNLAARLQGAAPPGSIVVSESVRRLAGSAFDYEDLGVLVLKGVGAEVHAFSVHEAGRAAHRFEAVPEKVSPLVGRAREMEALLERWQSVCEYGAGEAVLLSAEAGLGKSRLAGALRERLAAVGVQSLRLQFSPFVSSGEPSEIADVADTVRRASRDGSLLLVVEDLQWAGAGALETLGLLIEQLDTLPVMAVLTHRPEFDSRWWRVAWVTTLELDRLSPTQSRQLVLDLGGGKALPADLVEQIVAKTDGVPLFVEELTKTILDSGDLVERGSRYHYAGASDRVSVPETLRDSLMARLDRVADVKRIAQIGSVIGRDFGYELLAEIVKMDEPALAAALDRLVGAELALRRGVVPQAVFTFKHALLQEAAYESLLKGQRTALHAAIARALEERWPETGETRPELLAGHHTAAGQVEQAVPYWRRAGEQALRRVAPREAIAHLNSGLSLVEKLPPGQARDLLEQELRAVLAPAIAAEARSRKLPDSGPP